MTPPADEYTEPPEDVRREMDRSITMTVASAQTILKTLHHMDDFLRRHASPTVQAELHAFCAAQGWSATCGAAAFLDSIGFNALALHHAIDAATDRADDHAGTDHNHQETA